MYQLGVDLGTTWSAAAVCRPNTVAPEAVTLGEHSHAVASAVFAGVDGSFLLGEAAERRALSDPDRVIREFKRRIGDPTPVLVGREPVPAEALAARFIATVVRQVSAREGAPPSRIAVTHPAGWGPHKVSALRAALAGHGVGPVVLLSEPQAAAVGYAATEKVEPGSVVAVYDLGGGTFDAAVVRKAADGRFELLGTPEGLERLGGVDFDEAVFSHVRAVLGPAWERLDGREPAVLAAVARLRRECTAAKEALSVDTVVHVPVMLPGLHTRVRLGRADFEDMIRPAVTETVDAMRRAIDSARVDVAEVRLLLVGGSSRTPLVAELVSAGIGRPVSVDVDPKGVIAAGAALVAREADGPARTPGAAVLAAHGAGSVDPVEQAPRPLPTGPFERSTPTTAATTVTPVGRAAVGGAAVGGAAADRAAAGGAAVGGAGLGSAGVGAAGVGAAGVGAAGVGAAGVGGAARTLGAGPARPDGPAAAVRPSKQARPFSNAKVTPGTSRTVLAAVAAGVLAAAVLGGVMALSNGAPPDAEAVEPGPVVATTEVIPPLTTSPPAPETPAPPQEEQESPRPRETTDPTTTEPTTTTQPTTTQPTTTQPTTTQPTTTDPVTDPDTEGNPPVVESAAPDPVVPDVPDLSPDAGGTEADPVTGGA